MPTIVQNRQRIAAALNVTPGILSALRVPPTATTKEAEAIVRQVVGDEGLAQLAGGTPEGNAERLGRTISMQRRFARSRSRAAKTAGDEKPPEPEPDPDAEPDVDPEEDDEDEDEDEEEEEEDMLTPDKRKAAVDLAMSRERYNRAELEASYDAVFGQPRRITSDAKKRRPRRRPKRGATTDRQRIAAAMKHPAVLRAHRHNGGDLETYARSFVALEFDRKD